MSVLALREMGPAVGPVAEAWDAYVRRHRAGSFYHLVGWRRVIERAFGHRAHYLYVERDGAIAGVLPAFAAGRPPFSRALVSVPLGVGGGILGDDPEAEHLLRTAARATAQREQLSYVEYKSDKKLFDDLPTKDDLYFGFTQELYPEREKQLAVIPRKTRAVLRDAERAGLVADLNRTDLEPLWDLYALSLRNLGTPMFPRELFVACLEEFPRECDILTVRENGRILGAVMNFYFEQTILPFFAGTLPEARDVGINNYVYWVLLESGHRRGYRKFDFGRSKKDTGAFKFKEHFGMTPVPLEYQYDLVAVSEVPNVNPTNPKYKRAIEAWQRLPVPVTKLIGPFLSRRLP